MAKKRSTRRGQRDTRSYRSPQRLDPAYSFTDWPEMNPTRDFRLRSPPVIQDNRFYTPTPRQRSRTLSGGRSYVTPSPTRPRVQNRPTFHWEVPTGIGFEVPREVTTCVRRKQRREVLFAIGKRGRRGGSRRRNPDSQIRC